MSSPPSTRMNKSDVTDKFAQDSDGAEKGKEEGPRRGDEDRKRPLPPVDDEEFRRDARIWGLYLKEAGEEAKEQVELWKTGLESLLLFAGLFAGVVASFLVESRKKLRLEDQEFLLMEIRNALRNEPPPLESYEPKAIDVWVNGLWFTSLLTTLFGAIVGVLARSWLIRFSPINTRQEATEAYKRWMLDQRSERWRLRKVITFIPLLVQLAFFLFAAGVGLQVLEDHRSLGIVVLGAVSVSIIVYLVISALPLFFSPDSCPFQTPLSDILLGIRNLWRQLTSKDSPHAPHYDFDARHVASTLAKIWLRRLIKSPKSDFVDEAVKELNRKSLKDERIQFFAEADEVAAPKVILRRLQECMLPEHADLHRRNDIISDHLVALAKFADYAESHGNENLKNVLYNSLRRGQPLGQWTFFPEPVRALAFSVRAPLLAMFERDFQESELFEQPWRKTVLYMQPRHRHIFFLAACRGLVQGAPILRKVSAFSIGLCLANAARTGLQSEWSGEMQHSEREAKRLCRIFLLCLFKEVAIGLNHLFSSHIRYEPYFDRPSDASSNLPSSLLACLRHPEAKLRSYGVYIVTALALHRPAEEYPIGDAIIDSMAEMATRDPDEVVARSAQLAVLGLGLEDIRQKMLDATLSRIDRARPGHCLELIQLFLLDVSVRDTAMRSIAPLLVEIFFYGADPWAGQAEHMLLSLLDDGPETVSEVISWAVKEKILSGLQQENRKFLLATLEGIKCCLLRRHPGDYYTWGDMFRTQMQGPFLEIAQIALKDSEKDVLVIAKTVLQLLSTQLQDDQQLATAVAFLREEIKSALAWDSTWPSQERAIELLRALVNDNGLFDGLIEELLPEISALYNSNHPSITVNSAIIHFFTDLVEKAKFLPQIQTALPQQLDSIFNTVGWHCSIKLTVILRELALHDVATASGRIDNLIGIMACDSNMMVTNGARESLRILATREDLRSLILSKVPEKLEISDPELDHAVGWIRVLLLLIEYPDTRGPSCTIIAQRVTRKGVRMHSTEQVRRPGSLDADSVRDINQCEEISRLALDLMHYPEICGEVFRALKALVLQLGSKSSMACLENAIRTHLGCGSDGYGSREVPTEIAGELAHEEDPMFLRLLLDILSYAIENQESTVCIECARALGRLAWNPGKSRDVLTQVKAAQALESLAKVNCPMTREHWVTALEGFIIHADYSEGLLALVQMSLFDEFHTVRHTAVHTINDLAHHSVKLADSLAKSALIKNLERTSKDPAREVREVWPTALASISLRVSDFKDVAIPVLVRIATEDEHLDIRKEASIKLGTIASDAKEKESIVALLVKRFEELLKDPDVEVRMKALCTLDYGALEKDYSFEDCIKALLPLLLKIATTHDGSVIRETAENLLSTMIQGRLGLQDAFGEFALTVTGSIAAMTERGRGVAVDLVKKIPFLPEDIVPSTCSTLTPLLAHNWADTRSTALELLVLIYGRTQNRGRYSRQLGLQLRSTDFGLEGLQFIQSTIPDVIKMALRDTHDDLRVRALGFLVTLCSEDDFLAKIKPCQPQLMALLEVDNLRSQTIELLSHLSRDRVVRRSIAFWIIDRMTSENATGQDLAMQLLTVLIMDDRLEFHADQGSDYVLMLIAAANLPEGQISPYGFGITTGLLPLQHLLFPERYDYPTHIELPAELEPWFMFSVFGKHVTSHEVHRWTVEMPKYVERETEQYEAGLREHMEIGPAPRVVF
ncbi:hypothetical protein CC2G_004451 [Coprinopsis cinerea AmutBmut pab1-1]|nr:hypothetical protein CC2G_004451 [Coprinopsis cinerea AmutBmut pab1-1]